MPHESGAASRFFTLFPAFVSALVLLLDQSGTVVFLAEFRLIDFAGCISDDFIKDKLSGALVARQIDAEFIDLFFRQCLSLFHLYDRRGDLAETFVRQTDDRDIVDLRMCGKKRFNLDRIQG